MRLAALALLALAGSVTAAHAAEMRSLTVEHADKQYTMRSEVWFDASIEHVYDVFRRWDLSTQFSSAVVESRDMEADALGRPQYYIRNKGCILFFCVTAERQGHVESKPNEVLRAFANPETSDFVLSNETWMFAEEKGGTVVVYHLHMQPKFWVPPGIGPYLIKRKLKNNGGDAIDRIEVIAQQLQKGSGGSMITAGE